MTESIIIGVLGALICVIGTLNFLGYIETIHKYNRSKITEETRRPYGRAVGMGTFIIGFSMLICAVLNLIIGSELVYLGLAFGVVVGVVFIIYAQIKYNRGIF